MHDIFYQPRRTLGVYVALVRLPGTVSRHANDVRGRSVTRGHKENKDLIGYLPR